MNFVLGYIEAVCDTDLSIGCSHSIIKQYDPKKNTCDIQYFRTSTESSLNDILLPDIKLQSNPW
jgi:hypothetical protein